MRSNPAAKPGLVAKDEYIGQRLTQGGFATGSQPRRHWPALDGLRAVAVLGVMIVHLDDARLLPGGYLGVDVFFVLSGFLITSLLIEEWDRREGRVSFRNFYARRCLRLFPALGCIIVASSGLAVLMELAGRINGRAAGQTTLDGIPWVIIYVGNWLRALNLTSLGVLGQTWSLAVEEQFYLVWPVLFTIIISHSTRRRRLAFWLGLLALSVMLYRELGAHFGYSFDRIYFGTDTHCDGLLIGCAVAFWLASREPVLLRPAVRSVLKALSWLGVVVLIGLFIFGSLTDAPLEITVAVLATGVILVGLVMEAAPSAVERSLSSSLAVWIGRRSYGLYLWHFVVYTAAFSVFEHYTNNYYGGLSTRQIGIDAVYISALIASFVVAALSYRFIELPALRLKRRFQGEKRIGGAHRAHARRGPRHGPGSARRGVPAAD